MVLKNIRGVFLRNRLAASIVLTVIYEDDMRDTGEGTWKWCFEDGGAGGGCGQ